MGYRKALKAAFPHTIPVMTGYVLIGIAYGIFAHSRGYGFLWSGLMSTIIFAGAMQFVTVDLLHVGEALANVAFITLMVNARHIFYGLSMLEKYRSMGRKKPYMIFCLSDETFSLLCGVTPPEGVAPDKFYLCIGVLDQIYWIAGSMLGGLVGAAIAFDTKGIDFVMTALFTVTFVEQWRRKGSRIPALIGLGGSAICLIIFGPDSFILPSMVVMAASLTLFRGSIERGVGE